MPLDDALHQRQTDACALEFGRRVKPLEDAKQFVLVSHVKTDAIVRHFVDDLVPIHAPVNTDIPSCQGTSEPTSKPWGITRIAVMPEG